MIMGFEENLLDVIISECTDSTLFDEYVNYEQIVSESIVLSEDQQIKLDILREFSMKDIGKKLSGAFKAIKTFIKNLVFKLSVFLKNIGKEKIFRDIGKAISKLSPEEREEEIKYNHCKKIIVEKTNPLIIKDMDNCINYVMKVLKSKNKDVEVEDLWKKYHISSSKNLKITGKINMEWEKRSRTRIDVYKHYTAVSKKLDEAYNYFTKLSNKISSQADKLEKLADYWTNEPDGGKMIVSKVKDMFLPAMRINVTYLKDLASSIAVENKRILTEAIGLIKGDKSKIKNVDTSEIKGAKIVYNNL